jgi:DNA-binding NtrC family response regulator
LEQDLSTTGGLDAPVHFEHARCLLSFFYANGVQSAELAEGQSLVVGREAPADVQIPVRSLSRRHARVWREGGKVFVEDLGSRNGTHLGGRPIQRANLTSISAVQLASVTLVLQYLAPDTRNQQRLASYDEFGESAKRLVGDAQRAGRPATLLMLRATGEPEFAHVSRWGGTLRGELGCEDLAAVGDQYTLLLLLYGKTLSQGQGFAEGLVARYPDLQLRVGVAGFPGTATSVQELLYAVQQASARANDDQSVQLAEPTVGEAGRDGMAIVLSPRMRVLYEAVERVSGTDLPVLITGETGVGKELVASALHRSSPRRHKPFRAINCGAIPETLLASVLFGHERGAFTGATQTSKGIFEEADGGTVLLDEVGELSGSIQVALLRVLETRQVTRVGAQRERQLDVRIVAATHRDLEAMVETGAFRRDLLFRLNTITLEVPPLRERPEEIGALTEHFVRAACAKFGVAPRHIEPEALERLMAHDWPGNVRELRNVVERAAVMSDGPGIGADDLPDRVRHLPRQPVSTIPIEAGSCDASSELSDGYRDLVRDYEVQLITDSLRRAGGNRARAAELLKLPLRTLAHKIKLYGL